MWILHSEVTEYIIMPIIIYLVNFKATLLSSFAAVEVITIIVLILLLDYLLSEPV